MKERKSNDQLVHSNPAGRPEVCAQAIYDHKLQTFMLYKKVLKNKLNSPSADSDSLWYQHGKKKVQLKNTYTDLTKNKATYYSQC